jgi:DNA polymerase-4
MMHLDMDAFFPSVEQARAPFLRGKPVVVGSGVIASCSYEARRHGLHAGMALHEARRLCPHAVYLEGEAQVYRAFAETIWDLCHTISPAVDTYMDDAYLDLSGTERLYPDPCLAGAYLKQRIREETGLTVTLGLGPSRVAARMAGATAKPDGLRRLRVEEVGPFLAPLPVRELKGVGRKIAARLQLLGISTVGELRTLPLEGLKKLFGRTGETLFARCRGRDGAVIRKSEIPRQISRETTFHQATSDPKEIRSMLYYLVERGMSTVRGLGLKARTVGLRLAYSDWVGRNGQRTLPPFHLEENAFEAMEGLLQKLHDRRVSLRRVGVVLSRFVPGDGFQGSLFEGGADLRREELARAVDSVRERYGFKAIVAGPSIGLLNKLERGEHGYVLRTPSLTK